MNADPASTPPVKRPLVSLPFLVIVIALAAGAYFAGPTVMTYVLYLMPRSMIEVGAAPDSGLPDEGGGDYAGEGDAAAGESGGGGRGGRPGGGGGGRGGAGFDPEAFFAERDADGNGKLEGEEISERMQSRLADTDTDQDGAVSKEEFMASAAQRGGRGGGRPASDNADPSESNAASPANDNVTEPPAETPPAETTTTEPAVETEVPEPNGQP